MNRLIPVMSCTQCFQTLHFLQCYHHSHNGSHTPTSNCCHSHCGSCNTSHVCERTTAGLAGSGAAGASGRNLVRRTSMTRSRIPRPISLPKKLEAKLNSNFTTGNSIVHENIIYFKKYMKICY